MRPDKIAILLVDDSADDRTLTMRAFTKTGLTNVVRAVTSASEALAYLEGEGRFSDRDQFPFPAFILTDLKMENRNGFDLLERVKKKPNWSVIPVSVLSASTASADIQTAYALGACSYHINQMPLASWRIC